MVTHVFIIIRHTSTYHTNNSHTTSLTSIMGSSQSVPVQQVVNTIEQFGYHPATVFKFFVVIGILAIVTIIALATKKPLTSVLLYVQQKSYGKQRNKTHTLNMQEHVRHHRQQPQCPHCRHHCHHRHHRQLCLLPSTKTLEQWVFFLIIILPLYTMVIWCLLSRPIQTSLVQFTTATMAWSANPIPSLINIHNENLATSYAVGRTLTSQPILPAAAANTL